MIDHENAPAAPSLLDQILCQGHLVCQGFLHEHVLTGLQRSPSEPVMRMYRCGNSDRVYFPIREHFLKVSGRAHRRIPTAYSFELILV